MGGVSAKVFVQIYFVQKVVSEAVHFAFVIDSDLVRINLEPNLELVVLGVSAKKTENSLTSVDV